MKKMCKANMVFWREAVVYYRNLRKSHRVFGRFAEAEKTRQVLKEARMWQRYVEKIAFRAAVLLIVVVLTGCTASVGGGASVSAFYPKKWESPASRKQHTQPTLGMARNNLPMVGGAK